MAACVQCLRCGAIPTSKRDRPGSGESSEAGSGSSAYSVQHASGSVQNVPNAQGVWCIGRCGLGRQAFEALSPPGAAGLMDVKQGIIDRCCPSSRNRCAKTTLLSFPYNVFNL